MFAQQHYHSGNSHSRANTLNSAVTHALVHRVFEMKATLNLIPFLHLLSNENQGLAGLCQCNDQIAKKPDL